jgi:hypothetical protein
MQTDNPSPDPTPQREILLHGTQNEEDFNPYSVQGDLLTRTCLGCQKAIPERATLCPHCGLDFEANSKTERTCTPVDLTWEYGWPLRKRVTIYLILQGLTVAAVTILLVTGQSAGLSVGGIVVGAVALAFLLGTYDRLHLTRNAKGTVTLTRVWRYAFVGRPPVVVRWKEHEGIRLVHHDTIDTIDVVFTAIFLGAGILPGIVFWYFAVAGDRFDVTLCKDHGHASTVVFRSRDQKRAEEVMSQISDAARLPTLN